MSRVPRTQGPPCLDAQSGSRGDVVAGDLERIVGSIGLKVFSLRKRMGLSLQQLGERSDVSAAAIHKIEQGGMVPTITTLLKIAGALGRPVSYFVEEDIGQDDVAVLTPPDEDRPVYTSHKGIDLSSYQDVMVNAVSIYSQVSSGGMPPPGTIGPDGQPEQPWSQDKVNTFGCWIQQGCQP